MGARGRRGEGGRRKGKTNSKRGGKGQTEEKEKRMREEVPTARLVALLQVNITK